MNEEMIRVADIEYCGSAFTVMAKDLASYVKEIEDDGEDDCKYTITFKSMPKRWFDDLPEFDGF